MRYSECNAKALMFSQFLRDVRIYSGERDPLNVISTGKSSIFPILRKRELTAKKPMNIKIEGMPLIIPFILGKT